MTLNRWLFDKLSRTLEPELRESVVGDVAELKLPELRAVYELLGLILRRQAPLWRSWKPWLALVGIVGPVAVILSNISVGVMDEIGRQTLVYWLYGVPYNSGVDRRSRDRNCGLLLVSGNLLVLGRRFRDGDIVRPGYLHQWDPLLLGLVFSMRSIRNHILFGPAPIKCFGSCAS
jgi:hypothetical protein